MKFVSVDTCVLNGRKFEKQLLWYDILTTFPKNILLASENQDKLADVLHQTVLLFACMILF